MAKRRRYRKTMKAWNHYLNSLTRAVRLVNRKGEGAAWRLRERVALKLLLASLPSFWPLPLVALSNSLSYSFRLAALSRPPKDLQLPPLLSS